MGVVKTTKHRGEGGEVKEKEVRVRAEDRVKEVKEVKEQIDKTYST